MIVKKLKRTSFKKSKSAMIGGLVDYVLASHDDAAGTNSPLPEAETF
ncbi:hypothetical protein [Desulfovibrio sp. ZJ200]|nr:hypothetical protein [Desulfovibrio sp. ZJ200]